MGFLLREFKHIFQGIGCLKDQVVHLQSFSTTHHPAPLPGDVSSLAKVETKLQKLEVTTPWVSPIVVARKPKQPGEVRLCVDMRLRNTAIKTHNPDHGHRRGTPRLLPVLKDGPEVHCHHILLAPKSQNVTTFSAHLGLRRYKRLNFYIFSATEVFLGHYQGSAGWSSGSLKCQ